MTDPSVQQLATKLVDTLQDDTQLVDVAKTIRDALQEYTDAANISIALCTRQPIATPHKDGQTKADIVRSRLLGQDEHANPHLLRSLSADIVIDRLVNDKVPAISMI